MKRILLGTTALMLLAAPAVAADMPVKAPPLVVAYSWTGWYFGGYVGGATANRNVSTTDPVSAAGVGYNAVPAIGYRLGSSVIGGTTSGYNWQNGRWVFGVESEFGYIRLRGNAQFLNAAGVPVAGTSGDTSAITEIGDWYSAYTARLGMAWDRTLLYGKGGVAIARVSTGVIDTCTTAVVCGAGTIDTRTRSTRLGWAAGAGLEQAVSGNWSVKVEYLYLAVRGFDTTGVVGAGPAAGTSVTSTTTIPGIHTAKIGLNYHWGGPIVARY